MIVCAVLLGGNRTRRHVTAFPSCQYRIHRGNRNAGDKNSPPRANPNIKIEYGLEYTQRRHMEGKTNANRFADKRDQRDHNRKQEQI